MTELLIILLTQFIRTKLYPSMRRYHKTGPGVKYRVRNPLDNYKYIINRKIKVPVIRSGTL